ncbi:MarR family winged helix-turn-helix transcriptional regulator [Catenulispora rubra]|uniref:MarR family winged helix-turn-helix transcriptional regulator n=1 Tax=Catenulispora rubra TaxID=280293 RepID=UPI0018925A05|nr:MarR family transcriptional regulator [Catenulispora rubra]
MDHADRPAADAQELAAELQLVVGRTARSLRQAHAVGYVALSELSVLSRLEREGPDSPSSLAEAERVRPQAMAVTLATLEERGLVSRRQHPGDGRRVVIAVTDAGRTLLVDRRSESVRRIAAVLETEFTPAERDAMLAVLPLLNRLAERL